MKISLPSEDSRLLVPPFPFPSAESNIRFYENTAASFSCYIFFLLSIFDVLCPFLSLNVFHY